MGDPKLEADQESWTPYQFGYDNAIRYNDPNGECPLCLIAVGAAIGVGVDYAFQVGTNHFMGGKTWSESASFDNINTNSLYISAAAGGLSGGLGAIGVSLGRSATISVAARVGLKLVEGGVL